MKTPQEMKEKIGTEDFVDVDVNKLATVLCDLEKKIDHLVKDVADLQKK